MEQALSTLAWATASIARCVPRRAANWRDSTRHHRLLLHIQPRTRGEGHVHRTPPRAKGLAGYPQLKRRRGVLDFPPEAGDNPCGLEVAGANGGTGSWHHRAIDLAASPMGRMRHRWPRPGSPLALFIPHGAPRGMTTVVNCCELLGHLLKMGAAMVGKIKAVNNPLTIIEIFAALAEVAGTVALGLVDKTLQQTFVWFVMGFPIFLVALFFATLSFNPKVQYAPSDFKNEENFLNTLIGTHRVSMSLDEVTRQLEEAKNQILNQTVEERTAAGGAERSKLENIIDRQLRQIETSIELVREKAQSVASDASAAAYPQSYLQVRILTFLGKEEEPMPVADIARYANGAYDDTLRALECLVDRGLVERVTLANQTYY